MFESILAAVAGPLINNLFAEDAADQRISSEEAQRAQNREFAVADQEKNIALQREFAQHGVRWRVEDARQAGIHPMYALSGGGAAFAPNPIVMGGNVNYSRPSPQFGEGLGKALLQMFSDAKKDEALASAAASVAALGRSVAASATAFPKYGNLGDEFNTDNWLRHGSSNLNLQNAIDVADYRPAQISSSRYEEGSMTPGSPPGGTEFQISPSFRMILPASPQGGISESLEAMSESWELAYMYVQRNVDKYGIEWLDEAQRYLPITATLAKVINNVRNAWGWAQEPAAAWDALGHHGGSWLNDFRNRKERGPSVKGRIKY